MNTFAFNSSLAVVVALLLALGVPRAEAQYIVEDPKAILQLIEQIKKMKEMIDQLDDIYNQLEDEYEMFDHYLTLDHEGLAGGKFGVFFDKYKDRFDKIVETLESYQGGGLIANDLSEFERKLGTFESYHQDWDTEDEEDDPLAQSRSRTMKSVLFTKIQAKHALKAGREIQEQLKKSREDLEILVDDTAQAQGMLLVSQIGNQLTAMVADNLNNLTVQLNELMALQSAATLEQNQNQGKTISLIRKSMENWGTKEPDFKGYQRAKAKSGTGN